MTLLRAVRVGLVTSGGVDIELVDGAGMDVDGCGEVGRGEDAVV